MRIVSYNILDGGQGRADAVTSVILGHAPDVVALVEADNHDLVRAIAERAEMDFIFAPARGRAAALLSRFPIGRTINHAALAESSIKSLLEAQLLDENGVSWIIGVVHFSAGAREADEIKREAELDFLLKTFEPHRVAGQPHLLMGDFNSNAPDQLIDPTSCKPATRDAWADNGGGIPRRVVQRLVDSGYTDTFAAAEPQQARTIGSFTTEFPGQRVDYVFSFGYAADKIRRAWIDQTEAARAASDHFPIGLEISS